MFREAYRSVVKVRGPNFGLKGLAWLSSGLERAKASVDGLAVDIRRNRNRELLNVMYAAVLDTPPLACNPAAATEVHTVTGHHHFRMYLAAIKSLLRYTGDLAVVVHDDGSLDAEDEALVKAHLPGATFIDRASADDQMRGLLARYPHCRRLRDRVVNSLELFDNLLLARAPRLINMNSDVLFLREPSEVVSWISGTEPAILGVFEAEPAGQAEFLARRGSAFPPHVTTALACLYPEAVDLDFVEGVLSETTPDWFTAQNMYPLLYERDAAAHSARFLDQRDYQASGVFEAGAIFRHYWSSTARFTDTQAEDSARVLAALASNRP
ncbi:MAG TPA: hypothetical protein VI197_09315 [Polyangiaceae bacterium]